MNTLQKFYEEKRSGAHSAPIRLDPELVSEYRESTKKQAIPANKWSAKDWALIILSAAMIGLLTWLLFFAKPQDIEKIKNADVKDTVREVKVSVINWAFANGLAVVFDCERVKQNGLHQYKGVGCKFKGATKYEQGTAQLNNNPI